jgi:hypothetical protein
MRVISVMGDRWWVMRDEYDEWWEMSMMSDERWVWWVMRDKRWVWVGLGICEKKGKGWEGWVVSERVMYNKREK